jgi:hypothetical protein
MRRAGRPEPVLQGRLQVLLVDPALLPSQASMSRFYGRYRAGRQVITGLLIQRRRIYCSVRTALEALSKLLAQYILRIKSSNSGGMGWVAGEGRASYF